LAKAGVFAVTVNAPLFYSYLDESADERQEKAFCVGAFLVHERAREAIQVAWVRQLEADGVSYFRASDCRNVKRAFWHLRERYGSLQLARVAAAEIRENLENILLPQTALWVGFGLTIDIPEHTEARKAIPESAIFYSNGPTVAAYSQAIYTVTRSVRKNAPGYGVSFVFDESSSSAKIIAAYEAVKVYHPVIAKSMGTIAPANDRVTPPLQMADLVASITREAFLKYKDSGESFPGKWSGHFDTLGIWDAEHTMRSLLRTVKSKRSLSGRPIQQGPPSKPSKREIKAERRALIAKQEEKGRS
jgi:hypothetical protein